jgi:thiol-disulfide isomerase/thioredoxin
MGMKTLRMALAACLLLFTLSASAYEFTVKDLRGHTHHLSDYRGRWVLVNFWASWCAPCLEELPDLVALYNAHKKDMVVIGIAMEYPSAKVIQDFVKEENIPYPIVLGSLKIAGQIGPVGSLPTTYLFDPSGKPVSYEPGIITRAAVEAYMRAQKN